MGPQRQGRNIQSLPFSISPLVAGGKQEGYARGVDNSLAEEPR